MARLQLIEINWNPFFSTSKTAIDVPTQVQNYYPIPDFTSSILLENRIIAISATSSTAQPKWKYAGQVKQIIRTGLTVGGQGDTVNSVKKFYLNQISKIEFPDTAADFTLEFSIPYWIRDISIQAWEYTGPINNQYDSILNEIKGAVIA
jgi:hypothetical protein